MTDSVTDPIVRTPLNHRRPLSGDGLEIAELPMGAKFVLRGDSATIAEAVRSVTGLALPTNPLTSARSDTGRAILWLGPDEWMIMAPLEEEERVATELEQELASQHSQLADVTDYYTVISVSGKNARELLMKITTIDVHHREFEAGKVVGSLFGHANAYLWLERQESGSGDPHFQLIIRWSMADYLWCLLANCGRQWTIPPQEPIKGERLTIA